MKVIDKRPKRNNDWNVGDVICYWNKPDKKYYGLICEIKLPNDSGVGVIDLGNKTKSLVSFTFPFEKVNAKLVIE